jgi:predicted ABC-type ATPase
MRVLRFDEIINEEVSKNDPIPELWQDKNVGIILFGAPGSGKSTYAKNEIMRKMRNSKIFSTDDVSKLFTKDSNEHKPGSSSLNFGRLVNFMESGQNFIYDTTAMNDRSLLEITKRARENGYKLVFIHIIVDLQTAKDQNDKRSKSGGHKVDVDYIEMAYRRQFQNMKSFDSILKPDAYYIVMNRPTGYKYMKIIDGKLLKRKVDKYVPI